MNKFGVPLAMLSLLISCSKPQPLQPSRQAPVPTSRQPTLDPRSSAAAEELVRGFARLLNSGRAAEAYMLLGPSAPPRKSFDEDFSRIRNLQVTVGDAGDQEGAAGSIYVSVPLTVSGSVDGNHVSRSEKAVLRRVNDVPGSTEAQRHWHIERIEH
jgi:hypothetical protein